MYAKVFAQIFDSTIAEDHQVRHVFMDLLLLSDMDGVVNMTHQAIARRTNMPLDLITRAIGILESPDPQSRTPDFEGRRLVRVDDRDWGWRIVNYLKYRAISSEEQRREKGRERAARFRENGGGDPARWLSIRARILKLDNFLCGYCGKKANEVDHITPQSRGGDESDENLTACCRKCNVTKNNRTPEEAGFVLRNHRITHRITQDPPNNAMQKQRQKQKHVRTDDLPEANGIPKGIPKAEWLREALCREFQRPETDFWNYQEESGLADVARRPAVEAELTILLNYRGKNGRFFPQSIKTLLEKWQCTLDQARNWKPANLQTFTFKDPVL